MLIAKPPVSSVLTNPETVKHYRASGTNGNPGSGTAVQQGGDVTQNFASSTSEAQGYINTRYRHLLAKGDLIPPTPWEQFRGSWETVGRNFDSIKQFSTSPYYWYWVGTSAKVSTGKWNWPNYSNNNPIWVPGKSTLVDELSNADFSYYVQAAAAKIYSSGWDALTFGSELAKTVAMFRSFLQRILGMAVKGKLESLWLEGRYGWRTLVHDMKDIDAAIKNLNEGRKRFVERAGFTETYTTSSSYQTSRAWGVLTANVSRTIKVGVRGTVAADIEPPRFIFNPLITGWELTRLSFVIDWIINVGQLLESLSFIALQHNYVAAGGLSVSYEFDQTSTSAFSGGFTGTWSYSSRGSYEYVKRTPTKVPVFPLPKLRLDGLKVLDLVALIIQYVFKGKGVIVGTKYSSV